MHKNYITFISNRKKHMLPIKSIMYILIVGKIVEIHISGGSIYQTRMTLSEISENLGDGFIMVHRGCLVAARAIYDITDKINLINGESLIYTIRKKSQIIQQFTEMQKNLIDSFNDRQMPMNVNEYLEYYSSFDNMPFAFTDIEMVFDDTRHARDWIFRYGNKALARLEKISLEGLIGKSFRSVFSNMDEKWLKCYERSTLYGEILEIMDYSPEVDSYLKIISFPTFEGHCGCILFPISDIHFFENSDYSKETLEQYFGNSITIPYKNIEK